MNVSGIVKKVATIQLVSVYVILVWVYRGLEPQRRRDTRTIKTSSQLEGRIDTKNQSLMIIRLVKWLLIRRSHFELAGIDPPVIDQRPPVHGDFL